jgi:hypothetical protein
MGINDTLRGFVERWKERKKSYKDYESNEKMVDSFNQKKLPHNERVLNKLLEQNRQENIKKQLDFELIKRRNKDKQKARSMLGSNHELWRDNSLMKTKNIFIGQKSILKQ